jgi:hypothetical protein
MSNASTSRARFLTQRTAFPPSRFPKVWTGTSGRTPSPESTSATPTALKYDCVSPTPSWIDLAVPVGNYRNTLKRRLNKNEEDTELS